ncbi:MAG: neuromedin U [Cyanobacteriota bacterium]|nr:neuromedin U [Cyanobacteriota bacterium]
MAPRMEGCALLVGWGAACWLGAQLTAAAGSAPPAERLGFDWRPVLLAEAPLAPRNDQVETGGGDRTAEQPAGEDSQPVLREEAREGNTEALAKEAQNPVANLISLPIQWNATPGSQWAPTVVDPNAEANRTVNVWNVQPVVPFRLNDDVFLITRTIVPVIQRPLVGRTDVIGIGDINPTLFVVPRTSSRFQFGVGPTLVIPSATDVQLSAQRWSAGPAAVAVYTRGALVAGILANNVWSFAGDGGERINSMLIQPFINVNLPDGWYLASSPIITADWTARDGRGWTVPIGGGIGRIFRLGSQPFNASLQGFWNVARPETLGDKLLGPVTIRLQLQALFPTGG